MNVDNFNQRQLQTLRDAGVDHEATRQGMYMQNVVNNYTTRMTVISNIMKAISDLMKTIANNMR